MFSSFGELNYERLSSSSKADADTAGESEGETTAPLLEIHKINKMFPFAANIAIAAYLTLLGLVYLLTPAEHIKPLSRGEQEVAKLAFFMLAIATLLVLTPFATQRKRPPRMSGIVYAALVVQIVAIITNGIMAFGPAVVFTDPVTHSRVFLIRWCEWIPLAGLMTFLSEAVDLPKSKRGASLPVLNSLSQSLSCVSGIVFPLCPGLISWSFVMFIATITFLPMFPRVWVRYRNFVRASQGDSFIEMEHYDRLRFSYHLMLVCTTVWTLLVVLYFVNMTIHRVFPVGHFLRHPSLAMICDTLFDVLAKALYMKLIIDVHFAVFDAEGRAQRQLSELRNLMSVLWDSSSDVIIISVRHGSKLTSMVSPSFPKLVGSSLPDDITGRKSTALLLESERHEVDENPQSENTDHISAAFYVDSSEMPYGGMFRDAILAEIEPSSPKATMASGVIAAAWKSSEKQGDPSALMLYPFLTVNGDECKCEMKVSRHASNALIAVVRDVTERYKRFEAERKAHSETLARQKDAQSQTRFVRHEVKNGLLACIELCDTLRNTVDDMEKSIILMKGQKSTQLPAANTAVMSDDSSNPVDDDDFPISTMSSRRRIEELDVTLHEVLETVLAEAMARDVVHEVYHPRLERVDVKSLLLSIGSKAGTDRFPIEMEGEMPSLQLDPQLLRYIHRNAVSNACKYGKQGGTVTTRVSFDSVKHELHMQVVNEPGAGHDQIMALGDAANGAVFAQGSRLHLNLDLQDRYISSGDGAWIMQKCAKTMRGACNIKFLDDKTVFSFRCPAEPVTVVEWPETLDFEVPPETWGIAIDDSKIQRKLLSRIVAHTGVEESRRIVLGNSPNEVLDVDRVILYLLRKYPESKILVLMDENLDFGESNGEQVILSGSLIMKDILASLSADQEQRVFALVRSANDSADDVALYLSRTHGFFPKAPMQRDRVREILAPLWTERFSISTPEAAVVQSARSFMSEDSDFVSREDLLHSLAAVDNLLQERLSSDVPWGTIWGALHVLKGDLMVLESSPKLEEAVSIISGMRGAHEAPEDFEEIWGRARVMILEVFGKV